jgi:metallo-beta-lactamase family protein
MNWEPLPFDAHDIDAVLLTHAHLDHSGALPLLVRQGFKGMVLATPPTIDLCKLLLPDSGRIQEEDAAFANRHHTSRHEPAQPLYTEEDAMLALRRFAHLPFDTLAHVAPGVTATFHRAGHILGAASVALDVEGQTLLFSGDVGRPDDLLMCAPAPVTPARWIVVESTYGDRLHPAQDAEAVLGEVVARTAARGGTVVVPAFAVGRAQTLLYMLHRLKQRGAIPDLPVFLDSPMAIDMTAIYHRHRDEHRLSPQECAGMCGVAQMVRTPQQSRALGQMQYPAVIVSASGMATGGRVLHHLRQRLPDHRNTVVLAGYQAGGTRGARLLAGERTLRIFGEDVPVRAEVVSLEGMSAHADAAQLVQWLSTAPWPPQRVFVTHGEPAAADALRQRIERELGWSASVPLLGRSVELGA